LRWFQNHPTRQYRARPMIQSELAEMVFPHEFVAPAYHSAPGITWPCPCCRLPTTPMLLSGMCSDKSSGSRRNPHERRIGGFRFSRKCFW
jgi:hypothetical protein